MGSRPVTNTIGGTNAAAPGNSVIVYNGQTVLLRSGAPLDVNNNGLYDDNVFVGMADTNRLPNWRQPPWWFSAAFRRPCLTG